MQALLHLDEALTLFLHDFGPGAGNKGLVGQPGLDACDLLLGGLALFGQTGQLFVDIQQARQDPKYAHYLVQGPTVWLSWLNLNVHAAPLDNPKVRQAIAMAINRKKLVRLLGGLAAPTGNLYIPIYPQNDPRLDSAPVYAYDTNRAAALLKSSGYNGQPVTLLYPSDFGYNAGEATGIQQDGFDPRQPSGNHGSSP